MIRVLLVDDQHLVRMGLRMLCESAPDMEVVGDAAGGAEAVRLVEEVAPDVVLMDLRMPGVDGITATRRITAARPAVRVLAVTTFDDDDHLYPALAAGACGFVTKDTPPPELLDAIRRAADGDRAFSRQVLRRLVETAVVAQGTSSASGSGPDGLPGTLTTREREVLGLVAGGLSNRQIAERLNVGVTTVKTHIASLMIKLDCPNRIRLAVLAARHGLG
ncbi:DNA-binding NarL/FixJ family response regulator [Thermocatellispora tengchongensis]|uniref:DNA-binding NarL/FixJ family response regulator n=1 Tax=Thermocatellispora tengchongensis TaxID=1073253 RepID=A0A840P7U0_9ACTN|nr:response regulator transcription factor [Thermocatellispora tengchongensis]MBB5135069.1 DNA-binding NarL/FixJ family response regulator [Thermocatellispora tengchongensis]